MANSDKRIIYTGDDGFLCLMVPSDRCELTVEQIQAKDVPSGKTSYIIDTSTCLTDRSFRDAWYYDPAVGMGVTMTKAKVVHQNNIRTARKSKLVELDIEFQRALETSANTSTIVAKKQALRDAPVATGIATAVNPQDLKAQWDTDILGTSPYT